MVGGGEGSGADLVLVGAEGVERDRVQVRVPPGVSRLARAQPEDVVQHLDLAVAAGACADADGRYGKPFGHGLCNVARHRLEHDGERARVLDGERIVEQAAGLVGGAPLHAVAAELVNGLRGETEVAHHGDAILRQAAHSISHRRAAFQLHRLRAALLQQPPRVAQGVLGAHVVGHEGHVGHDEGVLRAADDRPRVVEHVVERHGERGVVAEHDVAEAVANEDDGDACLVHEPGHRVVVGGHADDGLARLLHLHELRGAYPHELAPPSSYSANRGPQSRVAPGRPASRASSTERRQISR